MKVGKKEVEASIREFADETRRRWNMMTDIYERDGDTKKLVIALGLDGECGEFFSQCNADVLMSTPIDFIPMPVNSIILPIIRIVCHNFENQGIKSVVADIRSTVIPFQWLEEETRKMSGLINGLSEQYNVKSCRDISKRLLGKCDLPEGSEEECELLANYALKMIRWFKTLYVSPTGVSGISDVLRESPLAIRFAIVPDAVRLR